MRLIIHFFLGFATICMFLFSAFTVDLICAFLTDSLKTNYFEIEYSNLRLLLSGSIAIIAILFRGALKKVFN